MLNPFLDELRSLKNDGLKISGVLWKFELYFSADWKFLAICLGLNGPTANYFCPWCLCSKHQHGDLNKDWHIEKNMEQIATRYSEVNGHIFPPLFDMISIDHIVFDELHVLLRITDRLWELMLAEIQECNLFNSITRKVILDEMLRLKVPFQFWEEEKSHAWKYTSLVGDDKKIVLQFFNLKLLFKPSRAQLIRKLWDEFYKLYCAIRNKNTNPAKLKQQSLEWLSLFLTPSQGNPSFPKTFIQGLYMPSQVTPYMHALVYHGWELLEKHQRWGLKAFSCSAVEKKNHNQVSTFFRKTLKNGGNLSKRKSAIQEIIEYENRTLYYTYNTLPESPKIKRVHIK
ncbi:6915_t:CDS:1 [Entrophospora sp. SA101]|nr:6473_t:CDS:1 [Entrophospora sp. SA101]CAJ0857205.1 6915_t:CDS:1 [Entrophospora sp. SA101]